MRRYHQESDRTKREHRRHLRVAHGWPKKPVTCPCDLQAGRFRKMDAYDCGQPLCRVCHYEKWLRSGGHEETRQEKMAKARMREWVNELA